MADFVFDEAWYREAYPDVDQAIKVGNAESGRSHYAAIGRSEGRTPIRFDTGFYTSRYALAAEELAANPDETAPEHYLRIGAARGYLPYAEAPRPDYPTAHRSRFGGLWLDAPNGADLIKGRYEIGAITADEAESLTFFAENGYMILQKALSDELLDGAEAALDAVYQGKFPELRFECFEVSSQQTNWVPAINKYAAKAFDTHMFSGAIRDAILAPRLVRMLSILFDAPPMASQTLTFLRGSAQSAHQDSAYVAYSAQRNFTATWIALEDVSADAGELLYYPGSHRFEDFMYGDSKNVWEAERSGMPAGKLKQLIAEHVDSLPVQAEAAGLKKQTFLAKRGDVLFWHPELAHGGSPVSSSVTRKSIVTHYASRFIAPLFSEVMPMRQFKHGGGYFMSNAYPHMEAPTG